MAFTEGDSCHWILTKGLLFKDSCQGNPTIRVMSGDVARTY